MRRERSFELGEVWGQRVEQRRRDIGLSQNQLADLCGVTQQTISKIERGSIVPADWLKQELARCLGTQPAQLFRWPKAVA